jgi:hypothetical protein
MRTVVLLLLLANLTFFGFARLDSGAAGETSQQVQPDKIKLLTPQQVAALGPDKAAALSDVCIEWGPFNESERNRALADLDSLALGKLLTQRRVEPAAGTPAKGAATNLIVIRDPSAPVVARLRELSSVYPNADVKAGVCEK